MNKKTQVYKAPSVDILFLTPQEDVAAGTWGQWKNGYFPAVPAADGAAGTASGVGIINDGLGLYTGEETYTFTPKSQ